MEIKEGNKKHRFASACWYRRYRRDECIFPRIIHQCKPVFERDQGQKKNVGRLAMVRRHPYELHMHGCRSQSRAFT